MAVRVFDEVAAFIIVSRRRHFVGAERATDLSQDRSRFLSYLFFFMGR